MLVPTACVAMDQDHERPTVAVISHDGGTREAVVAAARAEGYHCIGYTSGESFLDQPRLETPCCVVTEFDLPGIPALDLHDRLHLRGDHSPVIVIADQAEVATATAALRAGVVDFLVKPFRSSVLMDRVAEAVELSRDALRRHRAALRLQRLTKREAEIIGYLTEGRPVSEIARTLSLSPKTIQAHRANIMEKTGTLSVVELTRLCLYARPDLIGLPTSDASPFPPALPARETTTAPTRVGAVAESKPGPAAGSAVRPTTPRLSLSIPS
ncbi:MAG: response regulator transcription factor [Phycisphaerales bacterium]